MRNFRFRLGISQEELAWRADLHRTYIAGIEGGGRNITLKSLDRIARALGVSMLDLLSEQTDAAGTFRPTPLTPWRAQSDLGGILLVEDNPDDVALTLDSFKEARIVNPVEVVNDGETALECLLRTGRYKHRTSEDLPGLILLDLKLPRLGGLEVLRRIKAHPRAQSIPVIVLTGSKRSRDVAECKRLGAAHYIVKPVCFKSLGEVICQLSFRWALLAESPS